MTQINKALLQTLRGEIDAALAAVAAKHGLTIEAGNASFDPAAGKAKFQLHVLAGDGSDAARVEWERFAQFGFDGLQPEDFGREFATPDGKRFKITGCKPKSIKYPVLAEHGGKTYKFPAAVVARALRP